MSRETGMYLDLSDFDKKFNHEVKKAMPDDARKGLFNAMNELLRDSIEKPPQAPKDMGDLWGSTAGTVNVGIKHQRLIVTGGFNIKYAHRHHEAEPGEFEYTVSKGASQPGPKFMLSKMIQHDKKYMEIVAETIRRKGR